MSEMTENRTLTDEDLQAVAGGRQTTTAYKKKVVITTNSKGGYQCCECNAELACIRPGAGDVTYRCRGCHKKFVHQTNGIWYEC